MKKFSGICMIVLFFATSMVAYAQPDLVSDFNKSTPKDTALKFSKEDFVACVNGKNLVSIRFDQVTNPQAGNLKLNENILQKKNTISVNDADNLLFVPTAGYEGEAIFTWTAIFDVGSSQYPGAVVITIGAGDGTPSDIKKQDNHADASVPETTKKPITEKKITVKEDFDNHGSKPLRYEDMLTHWGAYSAGMLATRGYVIGEEYGNTFYFRPDEKITRLEYILMVNAIFGVKPTDNLSNCPFADKDIPSYIMRVGTAAHEYDIIEGRKDKNGKLYLDPYDTISRAEAITILDYALRLDSHGVENTDFKDNDSIPDWARQSVRNLVAYGIVQGNEKHFLCPNDKITRAQSAEIVWQALKFLDLKRDTDAVFHTVILGD